MEHVTSAHLCPTGKGTACAGVHLGSQLTFPWGADSPCCDDVWAQYLGSNEKVVLQPWGT